MHQILNGCEAYMQMIQYWLPQLKTQLMHSDKDHVTNWCEGYKLSIHIRKN